MKKTQYKYKVSLILPVYNGERYLARCLDTILAQSLIDFEVICINDVTPDNSQDIIDQYVAKDPRVKSIIHKVNKGHGPARNTGIKASLGKFIFHIDPDDTIPANSLEILYKIAEEHGSDLVRGCYERVEDGKKVKVLGKIYPKAAYNTNIFRDKNLQRIPSGHWLGLYRSTIFKQVFYPEDVKFAYDMVFLAKAYIAAEKISAVPDIVYFYHENPYSVMNSKVSWKKIYGDMIWRKKVYEIMCKAGLNEPAYTRFIASGEYVIDTFWKPMISSFEFDEIKEFFKFYRELHTELGIEEPWDENTSEFVKKIRSEIINGGDEKAVVLLGGTVPSGVNANRPKISVIIPIYNTEKYLRECIDSVCNQDLKEIEIICVNDCSPDNCLEIINEYIEKDKRVKLVNHEVNKGLTAARNSGVEAATGEYLRHLDSDDYIPSDALSALYEIAHRNDSDIVRAGGRTFIKGVIQDRKKHHMPFSRNVDNTTFLECQYLWAFSGCPFFLFKREFVEKHSLKFPVGVFHHEDYIYLSQALPLAKRISLLYKDCYFYRILPRKFSIKGAIEQVNSIKRIKANLAAFPIQRDYFLNYMRHPYCELMHNVKKHSRQNYNQLYDDFKEIYKDVPQYNEVSFLWNSEFNEEYVLHFFKTLIGYADQTQVENKMAIVDESIKGSVIQTLQNEIQIRNEKLRTLEEENEITRAEINEYANRLNDLYHSYSWKITKPARWAFKLFKGV